MGAKHSRFDKESLEIANCIKENTLPTSILRRTTSGFIKSEHIQRVICCNKEYAVVEDSFEKVKIFNLSNMKLIKEFRLGFFL